MTIKNRLTGLYAAEAGLSKDKLLLSEGAFWFSFFLAWLVLALPGLRYLSFSIPFLVLLCAMADRHAYVSSMGRAFAWYVLFGLAMYPLANKEGLKDLVLAGSGVSIAFLSRMPQLRLWTFFNWFLAGFLIYFGLGGALTWHIKIDIMNSYSPFESNYAFVFCAILPLAALQRRWFLFLLCAVMAVLTLKRIAILAGLGCTLLVFVRRDIAKWLTSPGVMLAMNVSALALMMLYSTGALNWFIYDMTGMSANAFGQGRETMWKMPSRAILNDPQMFLLWGKGAGQAYTLASEAAGSYLKAALHCDLLKIVYEYGLVAFCIFFWLLYATKSFEERLVMLYLNVLLMTDNCLTYYVVLFFVAVMARTQRHSGIKRTQEPAAPKLVGSFA